MRFILVVGLALMLCDTANASTRPTSCWTLRSDVARHALDYAFARASEEPLASAPYTAVELTVERCRPITRRRAHWQYSLVITDETGTRLADEHGTVMITRRRAVWQLTPS